MGSVAQSEDALKRTSFYYSDVRARYLQLCLPILEEILGEVVRE